MVPNHLPNISSSAVEQFDHIPPFPEEVATAPLLRLSFAKLLQRDPDEVIRLIRACEDLGFFYLDLSGPGNRLLSDAAQLFELGERLYDLPLTEKQKYNFQDQGSFFGYKELGANVIDKQGSLDRNEFYNISKDDIFGVSEPWPAPDILNLSRPLLKSFIGAAHTIVILVLEILNDHLGLPKGTLQEMHRLNGHSGDQVRLIKAPPKRMDERSLALGEHTDFGSVTVLFNRLGGLQILPPGSDAQWCYVKPLPNHAIINLGDALVKFTNGLLRSNIHRVVNPPGQQANSTRYSLVYFSRPEDHIMLRRLDGSAKIPPLEKDEVEEETTSKDWVLRRGLGGRPSIHGQKAFDHAWHRGTEDKSSRVGKL